MVRNIVGALVQVGIGKLNPNQIKVILEAKNREFASNFFVPAPARGLYLKDVFYDKNALTARQRSLLNNSGVIN